MWCDRGNEKSGGSSSLKYYFGMSQEPNSRGKDENVGKNPIQLAIRETPEYPVITIGQTIYRRPRGNQKQMCSIVRGYDRYGVPEDRFPSPTTFPLAQQGN